MTDKPTPRGEIIIGGQNVAAGYYKLPELTEEAFYTDEEGVRWFRTGDIGTVEEDGSLRIIDRKKDLVKLQQGEYVSLAKVETALKLSPLVENLCVFADSSKNFTVALVTPNDNKIIQFAAKYGKGEMNLEQV